MSTVWLTVLVSCERYVAICRPLDVASVCTVSRVRRAVATILLTSILFNLPRFVEFQVDPSGTILQKTDIGNSEYFRYTYSCVLYSLTLFLAPLCLLVFLNVQLLVALHRGRNEWINLQVVQRREQTITAIPLTIVVVFFICGTPSLAVNVIDSIAPVVSHSPYFVMFMLFANFLVVVNSASNIVVYCLVGRKFRSKLTEMFQCKTCYAAQQPTRSDGNTSGAAVSADWLNVELRCGAGTKSTIQHLSTGVRLVSVR